MAVRLLCLAAAAGSASSVSVGIQTTLMANPIRRVVNLLQQMQKKVTDEGERDKELFEKYMCYCKGGTGDLEKSIKLAEEKLPQITSALAEAKAKKEQLQSDLKSHKADRADAKDALSKASAIREKEASEFAKDEADTKTNLEAMGKAITAISKGATGGFLQTSSAATVRRMILDMDISSTDRDTVSSFLSQGQSDASDYAPASGEITGILKQMEDSLAANLKEIQKNEADASSSFDSLSGTKKKVISLNAGLIEEKTARDGQTGVEIANLAEDVEDTSASLKEDKDFLLNLAKNCKTKKADWEAVQQTRTSEVLALADTIKILNDDSALDLFKKTLPGGSSLLQLQVNARQLRKQAARVLRSRRHGLTAADPRLDLLMLAIRGKKVSFDKILGMVDDMIAVLKKEQTHDDSKKSYCEAELEKSEDEQKSLEASISDLEKTTEETKSSIETLGKEISDLVAGITALDKSVSEASETRKEENAEYKSTMASDTAAKELLKKAKSRLQQFYKPTEETSFVQLRLRRSADAPPPPPEAVAAYQDKGEESAGVLGMVDMLIGDLDKEMTEMETEEKDSQQDYEKYVADSKTKRATDGKLVEEKEGMKAEAEALLQKAHLDKKGKTKEAYDNSKIIRDLHQECDWLVSNYAVRKEARAGNVDSLGSAKAILSGADYALMQSASRHSRMPRH